MAKPSPTSRALADLREMGFTAQVVERWNPHARIRQDLFGCIDIVAIHPELGTLGVQACAGGSHATRRVKCCGESKLRTWLTAGNAFEIWSYAKQGPRGQKVKKWTLRREAVKAYDVVTA